MRYVVLLAVLAGCPKAGPGPTNPTPTQVFGHCSSQAISTTAEGLLGAVTTALATGTYVAEIAALATKWGAAEVGCAVDLVIAEFKAKTSRTPDAQTALVLQHAQAWRLANP